MNENNPNNQIPVANNVPVNGTTSAAVNNTNVVQNNTPVTNTGVINNVSATNNVVPVQSVVSNSVPTQTNVAATTTGAAVQSNGVVEQTNVVPPQAIPEVPDIPTEMDAKEKAQKEEEANQVSELIAASIDSRNGKVNLLTPEQKAELMRKKEEARKERESYQAPPVGKFKRFFSVFIWVMLFAIVMFLPEINNLIVSLREGEKEEENVVITTGTLRCTSDSVSDKYNHSYTYEFDFTDSKLDKLTYVEATVGDALVDEEDLNAKLDKCNVLKNLTTGLVGINVSCSLYEGTFTKEQVIDFNSINYDLVTSAYSEAEGIYPEFEAGENIDKIEKNMKAANNTCERIK